MEWMKNGIKASYHWVFEGFYQGFFGGNYEILHLEDLREIAFYENF